jgi:hypothetical protein
VAAKAGSSATRPYSVAVRRSTGPPVHLQRVSFEP